MASPKTATRAKLHAPMKRSVKIVKRLFKTQCKYGKMEPDSKSGG
jgi:hypothetical protein